MLLHFRTPLARVRARATVKLSAAFFHNESSITNERRDGGGGGGGGGGGNESASAEIQVFGEMHS